MKRIGGQLMKRIASMVVAVLLLSIPVIVVDDHSGADAVNDRSLGTRFAGGTGAEDDPYRISTVEQLQAIADDPDGHYVLVNDIDASETKTWNWNTDYNSYEGFEPIGEIFTGKLNGNGHSIRNLFINRSLDDYVGLFGVIDFDGRIENVQLINSTISGFDQVGGIAGENKGTIINSGAISNNSGNDNIGGLIGRNYGVSSNCFSKGTITGEKNVGGFCGKNLDHIENCYSNSTVTGSHGIGGFIGSSSSFVMNCYTVSTLYGDTWAIGSFAGVNSNDDHSISNCFWDRDVSNIDEGVGGHQNDDLLVYSKSTIDMKKQSTFMDVGWDFFNDGQPSDDWFIETECYPRLWWQIDKNGLPELPSFSGGSGNPDDPYVIHDVEDFNKIGHNPRLMDCYFILENDINFRNGSIQIISSVGYEFVGRFNGNNHTLCNIKIQRDFVGIIFGLFRTIGVDGIVEYLNVNDMSLNAEKGTYIGLLVGKNNGIISYCSVAGSIDGFSTVGGMVGENRGIIHDCSADAQISGIGNVGGFVGSNYYGEISRSCSNGAVNNCSIWDCGGFAGDNSYGVINKCFSNSSVSGDANNVGGFIGKNEGNGELVNNYCFGDVRGNSIIGGFCGYNRDDCTIRCCYSIGNPYASGVVGGFCGSDDGAISNCFWDVVESQLWTSDGGTGKSTSEMKTGSLYSSAGWDFDTVWDIVEGETYPFLRWQVSDSDGDGIEDENDIFPDDPDEWLDSDNDGIGDNSDHYPTDSTQSTDSDGDGYGNNVSGSDPDIFPNDPTEWNDTDNDGVGDNSDVFIHEPSQWADSDGDGYGDNLSGVDPDRFPDDPGEWNDTDLDGIGDNSDAFPFDVSEWDDSDDDGVGDNSDAFPNDPAASTDYDSDGYPDLWNDGMSEEDSTTGLKLDGYPDDPDKWEVVEPVDPDRDKDGIPDDEDAFPTDPSASIDTDNDGLPDSWNDGFGPEDSTSDPPLVIDPYPDDPDNEATDDDDDDDDSTGDDDADDDDTGSSGSDGSGSGMLLIIGLVAAIAIAAFLFFGKKKEPVGKLEDADDGSEAKDG